MTHHLLTTAALHGWLPAFVVGAAIGPAAWRHGRALARLTLRGFRAYAPANLLSQKH